MAFAADASFFVTSHFGQKIFLWNLDGSLKEELTLGVNGPVEVSPDGQTIVIGAMSGDVLTYHFTTKKKRRLDSNYLVRVDCIALSQDGTLLAYGGYKGAGEGHAIAVVDIASQKTLLRMEVPGDHRPLALAFAANGKTVFLGCGTAFRDDAPPGVLFAIEISTSKATAIGGSHQGEVTSVVLCPAGQPLAWSEWSGKFIITRSDNEDPLSITSQDAKMVRFWDTSLEKDVAGPHTIQDCNAVCFSSDGKLLAYNQDDWVYLYSMDSKELLHKFQWTKERDEDLERLRFSHDGKYLATQGDKGSVLIWRTDTWRPISRRP